MFDGFFEKNPPIKSETADKKSIDNIKAAVLKSIRENPDESDFEVCGESEVAPMKKRNIARTFIIAAAVAALGTMSLVSANAVTDNVISDNITNNDGVESTIEPYDIVVFGENHEDILIAHDYIEWIQNKDGDFEGWYEMPSEAAEALNGHFDYEYKNSSPEEILKKSDSLCFNGEHTDSMLENALNSALNENWEKLLREADLPRFYIEDTNVVYYTLNENWEKLLNEADFPRFYIEDTDVVYYTLNENGQIEMWSKIQ